MGKQSNRDRGNGQKGKSSDGSLSKVTLKIKRAKKSSESIKATFMDAANNEVKELVPTYSDGDPKEQLLQLQKIILKLGTRYDLFQDGDWRHLTQVFARALDGKCEDEWEKQVDALNNFDGANQKKKLLEMFQKMKKNKPIKFVFYLDISVVK